MLVRQAPSKHMQSQSRFWGRLTPCACNHHTHTSGSYRGFASPPGQSPIRHMNLRRLLIISYPRATRHTHMHTYI